MPSCIWYLFGTRDSIVSAQLASGGRVEVDMLPRTPALTEKGGVGA